MAVDDARSLNSRVDFEDIHLIIHEPLTLFGTDGAFFKDRVSEIVMTS